MYGTANDPFVPALLEVSDPSTDIPPVWIVSPADAAVWLGGVSIEDAGQLSLLTGIVTAAHDLVEGPRGMLTRCNSFRARTVRARAVDGAYGHILLPGGTASAVTLADGGVDVDAADFELDQISEYETHLVTGDAGCYEISYTSGSGDPAPGPVRLAIQTVIAKIWADRAALVDPTLRKELRAILEPWAPGTDWG